MVKNLLDYFNEVKNIYEKTKSKKHLFFRGHSDGAKYCLQPTVFRDSIYNEKEVLLDFKQYAPTHNINYDFVDERDKVLADMQHYKLPTRLLDWTLAPLNALYFSCCHNNHENNTRDGEVIVLNPWSYWLSVVRDKNPEIHHIHIIARSLLSGGWDFEKINKYIKKRYEYSDLEEEDIKHPFAYIASYTNDRILHQRGCFTIHGKNDDAIENMPLMMEHITRIPIDGKSKKQILEELNCLYVNEYSIYPDFEGMQKMIKDTGSLFNVQYFNR